MVIPQRKLARKATSIYMVVWNSKSISDMLIWLTLFSLQWHSEQLFQFYFRLLYFHSLSFMYKILILSTTCLECQLILMISWTKKYSLFSRNLPCFCYHLGFGCWLTWIYCHIKELNLMRLNRFHMNKRFWRIRWVDN